MKYEIDQRGSSVVDPPLMLAIRAGEKARLALVGTSGLLEAVVRLVVLALRTRLGRFRPDEELVCDHPEVALLLMSRDHDIPAGLRCGRAACLALPPFGTAGEETSTVTEQRGDRGVSCRGLLLGSP